MNKKKLIVIAVLFVLILIFRFVAAGNPELFYDMPEEPAEAEEVLPEEPQQEPEEPAEPAPEAEDLPEVTPEPEEVAPLETPDLSFRTEKNLKEHYEKHGIDMGFDSPEDYLYAANLVIVDPDVLHKLEKEDGDDVYYLEATNEFVVVSKDGYIRTYFLPDAGKKYYDKQ